MLRPALGSLRVWLLPVIASHVQSSGDLTISFTIPSGIEEAISRSGGDPASELKEAALVEMYRTGRISHGELAHGLSISRSEVDAVLRRHNVTEDLLTNEELGT
jgi:predicted HTH domain antitoxin